MIIDDSFIKKIEEMGYKRLCFISRNYRNITASGNKAKIDNEITLEKMGATNIGLSRTFFKNKVTTFFLDLLGVLHFTFCVRRGDLIVLQYPIKKYFEYLCKVAHTKGATTMVVIHDLGAFRRKKLSIMRERHRLAKADMVIASNEVMRLWLKDSGLTNTTTPLGLFDYRSQSPLPAAAKCKDADTAAAHTIIYASALGMRKNAFLLKWHDCCPSLPLYVYGKAKDMPALADVEDVTIKGFMPADQFIASINDGWGLVWDGDSTESCTGNFGEYLRYNSPHKLSFYLRAGLPVIVWSQSATAHIVTHLGIGMAIDNLSQIKDIVDGVTAEDYLSIKKRVAEVAVKLNSGGFLKTAITESLG